MSKFPLTHIYGVTRKEYYSLTGVTPEQMISSLKAECEVMEMQVAKLRKIYRRKQFVSQEGRYLASLLKHISTKIAQKRAKVRDIEARDL